MLVSRNILLVNIEGESSCTSWCRCTSIFH